MFLNYFDRCSSEFVYRIWDALQSFPIHMVLFHLLTSIPLFKVCMTFDTVPSLILYVFHSPLNGNIVKLSHLLNRKH